VTTYLSRSAWTSTSASGVQLIPGSLIGVAVHWPGTKQAAIGDPGQASIASRLRSYRDFHVNTRGWRDIGYNFAIDQAGRVWQLRTTTWHGNLVGAHAASAGNVTANYKYVGVLLVLGANEQPSTAMITAFGDWYHNRFLPKWPGRTDVRGHGQVPGAQTNCPGTRAKALIGNGTLTHQPTEPPEDDMPLNTTDLNKIDALIEKRLTQKRGEYGFGSTVPTSVASNGARYAWGGLRAANRLEAKADVILEAIEAMPGVDGDALAAKVAAAVDRLDAEAVAEQLEIDVKED